jgi:hypothetical protein
MNLNTLNHTLDKGATLDLVMYGDSIVERLNGRLFGQQPDSIQDQAAITSEMLTKAGGGKIDALALGIAGDEVSRLRVQLLELSSAHQCVR